MISYSPLLAHPDIWWVGVALLGLAVGLVAGMFGVGGGFLLTPLLNVAFAVPLDIAVGTGLCQMIGTATAALCRHRKLEQGEIKVGWLMLAGGLLGAPAGAKVVAMASALGSITVLGHTLPVVQLSLSLVYGVVLTGVACWMLYDARQQPEDVVQGPGPLARWTFGPMTWLPRSERRVPVFALAYLGLAMGFLSGLMGIGGGVILMPILIYGIGMHIRMAAGTGILLLLATAIAGTIAHAQMGHVHLGLAITLLVGSTIGAPVGATLTSRINGRVLRGSFGYLVLCTAMLVIWNLFRS